MGLLLLPLLGMGEALCQAGAADVPDLEVPRLAVAPAITAVRDDPAWEGAATIAALAPAVQKDGTAFPEPRFETTVRLGWDPDHLYLRFICEDDEPWPAQVERDGAVYQGDCVEIFLDPVGDLRAVAEIQVSSQGVIFDQQILLTTEPRFDPHGRIDGQGWRDLWFAPSWDAEGLKASARPWERGWIVDVALPAAAFLKRSGSRTWAPGTLRVNLVRHEWMRRPDGGERQLDPSYWSPVLFGCPHFSHGRLGRLVLIDRR